MIEFEPLRLTEKSVSALQERLACGVETPDISAYDVGREIGSRLPVGGEGSLPGIIEGIVEQVGCDELRGGIADGYAARLERIRDGLCTAFMHIFADAVEHSVEKLEADGGRA